ncbi:MAG TPA: hypothetical protein DF383_13250 [Deltaproteobacteria bacterium]|nr:hypothetical protein [Deltaproteobacteria bacterium]
MVKNDSDPKMERTTVYLPLQVSKLLKKAAKDNDRSFTKQITRIIKDWLTQNGYLKDQKD